MKLSIKRILLKTAKITGITLASILALMFLLPYLFPDTISRKIKELANHKLKGELNFSKARLSFFNHFPSLTLTLYNFSLKGSAPFQNDTLLASKELGFGINLTSLLKSKINIDKIFLTEAAINIEVDKDGKANYNVYAADKSSATPSSNTSSASLAIEQILIEKSHLVYNDQSLPMYINAKDFNYSGKGDLSKAIFDLQTHAEIGAIDFSYDNNFYFLNKKLNADLITKINTNSLELLFEKNDLKINKLPVQFNGRFAFLKNGYDMDFKIQSKASELYNLVTTLPPQYLKWLEKTDVKGTSDISAELVGQYIASANKMPDFFLNMGIREGAIKYEGAPASLTNLFLDFNVKLPGFNTDSLHVNIDSISFNIDKDYFKAVLHTIGTTQPYVTAKINTDIDLEKWNKALGVKGFDIKGRYMLHMLVNGKYATGVKKVGLRKTDTVITSIPSFNIQSTFANGYFKYDSLPQAVHDISFKLDGSCPDNNYRHTSIALENINANALNNFIKGYVKLMPGNDFPIDANLKTVFQLADIKKFYPLDSLDVKGNLNINVQTKGKYNPAKKLFPATQAIVKLDDGSIQTKYYPHPIDQIKVDATITNTDGTIASTKIFIKPVSFTFEEQPFFLKANFQNFNNLTYDIASKGIIDIGKIYKVFAYKGLNAKGYINANVALKGSQKDIAAGRFDRLVNSGTLQIRDVTLTSDDFPKPFLIQKGVFSFKQDKMWFDAFSAKYGRSDFMLNGYLSNIINYILKNEPLKGNFDLKSKQIDVDEFMAFADTGSKKNTTQSSSNGVVIIPSNLDMVFTANAAKVLYNGLSLTDAKGQMLLQNGTLSLQQTGFGIINALANIDATYKSLSPRKAQFSCHLTAKDFDVRKAYNEIKLFHDMAPSAASAQGVISIDYNLQGKLNDAMMPVYPSLSGNGVLSVKQVKMKGFKLMNAISNSTGKNDIKDPDLSKVDIKSKIANNIITIERVKLRVAGFRPRFEGQVSFDGKLNLTGRLGLPPFGIFGIPFTVTGTQEKPSIHLRRQRDSDKLEETEEKDNEETKQ